MADAFESVDIRGMRRAHFKQLLEYIDHIEEKGVYWGHRNQFWKRHHELRKWVESIVDRAYAPHTVIPSKQEMERPRTCVKPPHRPTRKGALCMVCERKCEHASRTKHFRRTGK